MTTNSTVPQDLSVRLIRGVNLIGLKTLVAKEVGRFMNVYTQTILAPVVTTLLYYTIFAVAFGGVARHIGDVPYLVFLAPGLIMMTMVQNAFANTSSSLMIAKVQGNIVDVLMPPLSPAELLGGYMIGGLLRGLLVGIVTTAVILWFVPLHVYSWTAIVGYAVLGNLTLSALGIAGGLWSEKFDHIAAITNFLVTPLTFLSGTFYSIDSLPPFWQSVAAWNPFFHMIDGFRYGLTGHADGNMTLGVAILTLATVLLSLGALFLLKTGYKIKS